MPAWLVSSIAFWSFALKRPLGIESVVSLVAALGLTWGPFAEHLQRELGEGYIFWVRAGAWFLLIGAACLYAPGRIIEDHKASIGRDFYRLDPDPAIDRAYRRFDRLLRRGVMFQNATIVQRREWDEEVRRVMADYCNEECTFLYLINTGRVHDVHPIEDGAYPAALDHVKQMLDDQLKRSIRWPA